jgi:hypothetical protein
LEHTGRLFANNARNHGQINNPLRLKQVIAGANNNFHDALDQLEGELVSCHDLFVLKVHIPKLSSNSALQRLSYHANRQTDTDNVIRPWHALSCVVILLYTALNEEAVKSLKSRPK